MPELISLWFNWYHVVTTLGSFALMYWVIPTNMPKLANFRASFVLSLFGFVLWPLLVYVSIVTLYFTNKPGAKKL